MSPLTLPTDRLDQKVSASRGDFTWPTGPYRGVIEETDVRPLPEWAGDNPNNGWESTDGEVLSIQLGQLNHLEEDAEIGNRKFFVPEMPNSPGLTIRDGNITVEDVDVTDGDAAHWKLQRAANYIGRLARALGQIETNGDFASVRDGFVEDLASGKFNGSEIGFELFHDRTYERDGTEVQVRKIDDFFPV